MPSQHLEMLSLPTEPLQYRRFSNPVGVQNTPVAYEERATMLFNLSELQDFFWMMHPHKGSTNNNKQSQYSNKGNLVDKRI